LTDCLADSASQRVGGADLHRYPLCRKLRSIPRHLAVLWSACQHWWECQPRLEPTL